jgi:hypothetical protein
MGCACGKGRAARAAGVTYTYSVTLPDGSDVGPFLTPLEAKREIRRAGGGTVRREEAPTAAT